MNIKGSLPLLILQILTDGPSHGYRIAKSIKELSQGQLEFAEGTLYPTLQDLERKGLIAAEEQEVRGRVRRSYRLTKNGQLALEEKRSEWQQFETAINLILGGAQWKPTLCL